MQTLMMWGKSVRLKTDFIQFPLSLLFLISSTLSICFFIIILKMSLDKELCFQVRRFLAVG